MNNLVKKKVERNLAIKLRKEGKTYSQILSIVPVAKSTLALWLHSVKLAKKQKQRITAERLAGSRRGGEAKKKQRLEKQSSIISKSKGEIGLLSDRELFLVGVALYWAEGSKEKEHKPGSPFEFSNMDPRIIKIIIYWLIHVCKINKNMLIFNIFLHKTHKHRVGEVKEFWSKNTGFPIEKFGTIYWKRNSLNTNRKNTEEKYHGVLKIKVKESSSLVRQIAGWSDGIFENIK